MSEGQTLLERCLLCPSDGAALSVFADWLQENGEAELESAMRGERAQFVLQSAWYQANSLRRPACLRLLWFIAVGEANDQRAKKEAEERRLNEAIRVPRDSVITTPDGQTIDVDVAARLVPEPGPMWIGLATAST